MLSYGTDDTCNYQYLLYKDNKKIDNATTKNFSEKFS